MRDAAIAELCIFVSCSALFLSYHVWLFFLRPLVPFHRQQYFNIYSISHKSRGVWAEEVADSPADPLQTYSIQTLSPLTAAVSVAAASFLATACSLIAVQGILPALLDQSRIDRLDRISAADPITRGPGAFDATTKLAIAEVVICTSFLAFAQSVRLHVHLGFYVRVVPSKRNLRNAYGVEEAIAMSLRAATTFTLGFRAFYAFIPLLMWLFGPTALLCATVLEVVALYFTDTIKLKSPVVLEGDVESQAGRRAQQQEQVPRQKQVEQERRHAPGCVEMSNGSQSRQKRPVQGSSQHVTIKMGD